VQDLISQFGAIPYCGLLVQIIKTDMLMELFNPGVNGMSCLPNIDLIALTGGVVYFRFFTLKMEEICWNVGELVPDYMASHSRR
jgi:hypothetical protein